MLNEVTVAAVLVAAIEAYADARVAESRQWQPIATAPKDGTWILAWRGPTDFGDHDPMVIVRWHEWPDEGEETAAWAWPEEPYDVWTRVGRRKADAALRGGNLYEDNSFTHWMPLPAPPDSRPGQP